MHVPVLVRAAWTLHPHSLLTKSPTQRVWRAVALSIQEADVAEAGVSSLH